MSHSQPGRASTGVGLIGDTVVDVRARCDHATNHITRRVPPPVGLRLWLRARCSRCGGDGLTSTGPVPCTAANECMPRAFSQSAASTHISGRTRCAGLCAIACASTWLGAYVCVWCVSSNPLASFCASYSTCWRTTPTSYGHCTGRLPPSVVFRSKNQTASSGDRTLESDIDNMTCRRRALV